MAVHSLVVNRMRKVIYDQISRVRHEMNAAKQTNANNVEDQ